MKNFAAIMTDIKRIENKEIKVPVSLDDEVLIRVEYVGICGSDVHFYEAGKIGDFLVETPFILGHEASGTIEKSGKDVKNLKPGDRIAIEPSVPCRSCKYCSQGKYNICSNLSMLSAPPFDGALKKYITHPSDFVFKLPENVSTLEGALVEPLCVGLHAVNQSNIKLGDTVTILGAGCIGLTTLLSAKAAGASKIFISDIEDKKLEYAKELGATEVLNAKNINIVERVMEITEEGTDKVIDCAGSEITIAQTSSLVKKGGSVALVGMTVKNEIKYDLMQLLSKEANIQTVFRYRNLFPTALDLLSSGRINIVDIVTNTFSFDETKEAFDYVRENRSEVVKGVIKIN